MPGIIRSPRNNPEKLKRAKELRQRMTETEAILWCHLRRNQLNGLHFRRQQVVFGYIGDFYCHAARLVVEVDGGIHDTQKDKDRQRDQALENRGLKVLRFKNEEIHTNLPSVLTTIAKACGKLAF